MSVCYVCILNVTHQWAACNAASVHLGPTIRRTDILVQKIKGISLTKHFLKHKHTHIHTLTGINTYPGRHHGDGNTISAHVDVHDVNGCYQRQDALPHNEHEVHNWNLEIKTKRIIRPNTTGIIQKGFENSRRYNVVSVNSMPCL